MSETQLFAVKQYYSEVLNTKNDLKTSACCAAESLPEHIRPHAAKLHPEIVEKFYGCGAPFPNALDGSIVLDLGCGTGRDCYLLSSLVGPNGKVIGVDMTEEQLAVARKHQQYQTEHFGMRESNVDFRQGYIEDLRSLDIADNSIDVVISNCVINLSPDKEQVFKEIFRVLKPGGELYFSDVFADRRLSDANRKDTVLLGECLGGALYFEDFRRLLSKIGCLDFRTVNRSPIELFNPEIKAKLGLTRFESITIRAFKLDIEDRCEDYGQVAYYLGTIKECPNAFVLDDHHLLEKNRPLAVCSNSASMLKNTRYGKHFRIEGDLTTHFGLFPCGSANAITGAITTRAKGASCC